MLDQKPPPSPTPSTYPPPTLFPLRRLDPQFSPLMARLLASASCHSPPLLQLLLSVLAAAHSLSSTVSSATASVALDVESAAGTPPASLPRRHPARVGCVAAGVLADALRASTSLRPAMEMLTHSFNCGAWWPRVHQPPLAQQLTAEAVRLAILKMLEPFMAVDGTHKNRGCSSLPQSEAEGNDAAEREVAASCQCAPLQSPRTPEKAPALTAGRKRRGSRGVEALSPSPCRIAGSLRL